MSPQTTGTVFYCTEFLDTVIVAITNSNDPICNNTSFSSGPLIKIKQNSNQHVSLYVPCMAKIEHTHTHRIIRDIISPVPLIQKNVSCSLFSLIMRWENIPKLTQNSKTTLLQRPNDIFMARDFIVWALSCSHGTLETSSTTRDSPSYDFRQSYEVFLLPNWP